MPPKQRWPGACCARAIMFGDLEELADRLIRNLTSRDGEIGEGFVRTVGPPGYRRLDVDGRALAYVRPRPKKGMVRIDVPGCWRAPLACRLSLPAANGWALAVRSELDVGEAVQAILTAVAHARIRRASSSTGG
jgi:hypothetical protein